MIKTCGNGCKHLCGVNSAKEWPHCDAVPKENFDKYLSETTKKLANGDFNIDCEHFTTV